MGRLSIHKDRVLRAVLAVGIATCGVSACWVDFPDGRFDGSDASVVHQDARRSDAAIRQDSAPADARRVNDTLVVDATDARGNDADGASVGHLDQGVDQTVDQGVDHGLDQGAEQPPDQGTDGQMSCGPKRFVSCLGLGGERMLICTPMGSREVDCRPGHCQPDLERCDQCDPADADHCEGDMLVSCTIDGIEQTTNCSLGCAVGACCTDGDGDGVTTCDGDCNDNDRNVHPGQSAYFDEASLGSFDYDCDTIEELETNVRLADCGDACVGTGWIDNVPDCGLPGTLATCLFQYPPGEPPFCDLLQGTAVQRCH